jgi:hypothetical protein
MKFIVYALPRSRTKWLSEFLSYGDHQCAHEQARYARTPEDVANWFQQPNTGTVETSAAPFWRTVRDVAPDARVLVVRRPVEEVERSLLQLDMSSVGEFIPDRLHQQLVRLDAKLDQIEARVPGVLSVRFADLAEEATCAKVFTHCLGYTFDRDWWKALAPLNLQCDLPAMLRFMLINRKALERLTAALKRQTLAALPRKPIPAEGITFQSESCATWLRDGVHLFREHSIALGEAPDDYKRRNWEQMLTMDRIGAMQIITGRCNGRMFGYCVSFIGPATDDASKLSSFHISIYCSPDFAGMGMRLQKASIAGLRARGCSETFFRAGVLASGPKMSAMYRRLGAENIGQLYRLPLDGG